MSPEEPQTVGDYRLLARIGEGGMGVVHLAQAPDGRRVALKVLRPHVVGDSEARERLAREVSSLRRISSPRIAEILDADPHGPTPFVVTRYVPGLSLYHHVEEEGRIEGDDLLHCADALAEALQAVHAVGVLHRDIKPTNVLMEGRSPVLIDFGLARVAEDSRLTQTGWLLGTPGYLAPEILYGDDATTASDVHSWAATVVFAATGRPPYGKGPAMAIMDRVRRGEHDLSQVPEPLRSQLKDALSPDPLERPTLHELRTWLRREREDRHLARDAARVSDQWTMPFAPSSAAARDEAEPVTAAVPLETDRTPVIPVAVPPAATADGEPAVSPPTRILPSPRGADEGWDGPALAPAPRPVSRPQRMLQLLGLGALAGAAVAYAPYLGTALVAVVVLLLRTASVTRQRHERRRMLRGRPRWYDVPTTTLSTPGYLVLGLLGTVADLVLAGLVGLAGFSIGYLAQQPVEIRLLMAGAGFVPGLWWGPGSSRLRETSRRLATRTASTEFGGWFVVAMSFLGSAVLVALLLGSGANWAPGTGAPWR